MPNSLRGILSMKRTPPRSRSSSINRSANTYSKHITLLATKPQPRSCAQSTGKTGEESDSPLACCINSWEVTFHPDRKTTKATGSSPSTSCGRPTTPTSSTPGCVSNCFSMFEGATCNQVISSDMFPFNIRLAGFTCAMRYLMSSL